MTIGSEEWVKETYRLFDQFYSDTRAYREKCRENEAFWQANHWRGIRKEEPGEPQPVTPVLFSTLENLLSDIMDSYPQAVILGEEPSDDPVAGRLGQYLKYIYKRRGYRSVFREKCRNMLKKGTSVQEIYWDTSLYGGLGDINIREIPVENFLWDDDCERLQDGKACFVFSFHPKKWFDERYPGKSSQFKPDVYESRQDEKWAKDEYMLVEYWYKTYDREKDGYRVHLARLAGHTLLEASEQSCKEGMFAHGMYPFIVERLYPMSGKLTGLSLIDIFQNVQLYADKLDQIIVKNALLSGKMKMLVNKNADLDENALTDWSCEVVRGNRIDEGSVRWFQPNPLSASVMVHYNNKLNSIKEESGQNLFNRGEVGKGVTAASAIMALQEAGSKRSRLIIEGLYDGFEQLTRMMIELMVENYSEARYARLDGEKAVRMQKDMLVKQNRDGSYRSMDFDVSVHVEKQLPYQTLYQNELALDLLRNGIIQPDEALSLMTFEGKDAIYERVASRMAQAGSDRAAKEE